MKTMAMRRARVSTAKERVKQLLRTAPAAYKAAEILYENSLFAHHVVVQGLGRRVLRGPAPPAAPPARQQVITWNVALPPWSGHRDLIASLRAHGLQVFEGGHTVYVPPQAGLRPAIGPIADFYPPGSGFKILKDCRPPERARYLHKHRRTLPLLVRMIGTPLDQLVPANYLYASGIGPRVWDVTSWAAGGSRCTVFVVAHVEGRATTSEECDDFVAQLEELQRSSPLRVLIPDWQHNEDFRAPDCNGNLFYSAALARPQYVDFQNFGLTQPAKLDHFTARSAGLAGLFRGYLVDLAGRLVVDRACRDGATIAASLARGAAWAVGWSVGDRADTIEASLLATGFSRFTLVRDDPRDPSRGVPAHLRDRLPNAVVFSDAGSSLRLEHPVDLAHAVETLQ